MKQNKQPLAKAFIHAFNGMKYFSLHERNGKIQLSVAVITIAASVILRLSTAEWMMILLCIGMVLGFEMVNSAVEKLCGIVHEEYHPVIKVIKDVAAGAVLWSAIISIIIGFIIFLPKFIQLL